MGDGGSGRKSKRVAKRAEDDMFWLMHNFPKGIDPNDPSSSNDQIPKATSKLICSVNEKINDLKHSVHTPKTLRSGKVIKRSHVSDGEENDSDSEERSPKAEEKLKSPNKRIRKDMNDEDDIDIESLPPELREKHETIIKAKLPKFQSQPNKLSTRSGAQYPFTWNATPPKAAPHPIKSVSQPTTPVSTKSTRASTASSDSPASTSEEPRPRGRPKSLPAKPSQSKLSQPKPSQSQPKPTKLRTLAPKSEPSVGEPITNGNAMNNILKPTKSKTVKKSKLNRVSLLPPLSPLIKEEPLDSDASDTPDVTHSIYPRFMWNLTPTKQATQKSSPKVIKSKMNGLAPIRKRKKLSLLPTQHEDRYEVFNSTWLDALNSPDSSNGSKPASPRSDSPRSTASSEVSLPEKRAGRTASLNCRAVLSALIKTEPSTKKIKKSPSKTKPGKPAKVQSNNKLECKPDSYFNVRVNNHYSSKIDFHHNGLHCKVYNPPSFLKIHEENILEEFKNVGVSTNGWQWIGSYVECSSFYNMESKETTRLYFSAMSRDGVVLRVGDSVALQSSPDIESFVGKIISMWQDNLGEMMVTMCWFYRPSDLDNIKSEYGSQELYLSKHTDDNSVATIQDKVYVISYPEYCRYHSCLQQRKVQRAGRNVVPNVKLWRDDLLPISEVSLGAVYFCRAVYDFRLGRTLKQHFYYTKYL